MKILLFLASNSPWYKQLYKSIKRGFEEAGCEVIGDSSLLEPNKLIELIKKEKPAFVFEHNRVKSEIPAFPKNVVHICWLVDFWGRKYNQFKGSDILYVWAQDWIKRFNEEGIHNVHFLPPATDANIYTPLNKVTSTYDYIFLGHISKKWTKEELNRFIGYKNNKKIFFKDILPIIKKYVMMKDVPSPIIEYIESFNIIFNYPIEKSLRYDIMSRVFRQTRREHYIDTFANLSKDILIYGSENWKLYPKYKDYYKKYIESPIELNKIIQNAHVLLHDGNYPHFRTFDAMAAGVPVAAVIPPNNFDEPWEKLGFIDQVNYISIDIFNNHKELKNIARDEKLQSIAKNARDFVLKNHLWKNRALQVIKDFKKIS